MSKVRGAVNRQPAKTIFEDCIVQKPPQCRVFACYADTRNAIRQDCCFFCPRKYACPNPCLNHPSRCGLVVVPRTKESETNAARQDDVP